MNLMISPNELPKSSLYLLNALFTQSALDHITEILTESLRQTCEVFISYRDKTYALSGILGLAVLRRRWLDASLREQSCGGLRQLLCRAGEVVLQTFHGKYLCVRIRI